MKDLPFQEALGIFLSIAGVDYLAAGNAEPIKALAVAIGTAAFVIGRRRWRARQHSKAPE